MPYTAHPVWMFPPNWGNGVTERLEWITDVLPSETLAEQRISRRLTPRRFFRASFLLSGVERKRFASALAGKGSEVWLMPVWPDIAVLTASASAGTDTLSMDTRWREHRVGGLVLLRGSNSSRWEVGTIESLTDSSLTLISNLESSWGVGTKVYPAVLCRLEFSVSETKRTDQAVEANVAFRLDQKNPYTSVVALDEYRGTYVYSQRPDDSEELETSYSRQLSIVDNQLGIPLVQDVSNLQQTLSAYLWSFVGREASHTHRSLLYHMRGRAEEVWLPTFMDDFSVSADIAAFDTAISVTNCGYTQYGARRPGREDVFIELRDGSRFYRRILSSAVVDADTETLTLDAPLFRACPVAQIRSVSFLQLSRLGQESFELEHPADTDGLTQCRVTWLGPINPVGYSSHLHLVSGTLPP